MALNYAVRSELLARNVAQYVRIRDTAEVDERQALSPSQGKLLLSKAGGQRLYAAYVLGLIGLRQGEILGLRWSDVDLEKRTLHIRQTVQRVDGALRVVPPKSRRSRRTLPLPGFVLAALRTQAVFQDAERQVAGDRWQGSGLVVTSPIGTTLDPRNFHREWVAFRDSIDGLPPVKLHELRHTCVSLLLELGVSPRVVMEIVGHAGLDMTMNTYGHVRLEMTRQALDQLSGLFTDSPALDIDPNDVGREGGDAA